MIQRRNDQIKWGRIRGGGKKEEMNIYVYEKTFMENKSEILRKHRREFSCFYHPSVVPLHYESTGKYDSHM